MKEPRSDYLKMNVFGMNALKFYLNNGVVSVTIVNSVGIKALCSVLAFGREFGVDEMVYKSFSPVETVAKAVYFGVNFLNAFFNSFPDRIHSSVYLFKSISVVVAERINNGCVKDMFHL